MVEGGHGGLSLIHQRPEPVLLLAGQGAAQVRLGVRHRSGPAALHGDLSGDDLPGPLEGDRGGSALVAEGDLPVGVQSLFVAFTDGKQALYLAQQKEHPAFRRLTAENGELRAILQPLEQFP